MRVLLPAASVYKFRQLWMGACLQSPGVTTCLTRVLWIERKPACSMQQRLSPARILSWRGQRVMGVEWRVE